MPSRPRSARLAELRAQYLLELPHRADQIADGARRWLAAPEPAAFDEFYTLTHQLSGSSGIYGCRFVHEAAAALEALLLDVVDGRATVGPDVAERLERQVATIDAAVVAEMGPLLDPPARRGGA